MSFIVEKKVGETPLAALERARKRKGIAGDVPMTYAGRLDPMASGKLLILVGDECKSQEEYRKQDKEYEVEVLLGVGSDTGDILGIIEAGKEISPRPEEVKRILASFVGPYHRPYPAFSSKTVDGKPLFQWALEGKEVEAPLQDGTIKSITYRGMRTKNRRALLSLVRMRILLLVPAPEESKTLGRDFRREDVLASWEKIPDYRFPIIKVRVRTSSGVYMRTLAEDIGQALGTNGLALSIHRTNIFPHTIA